MILPKIKLSEIQDNYLYYEFKSEAQKWAKEQEVLMQSGVWSKTQISNYSLEDLLNKYKKPLFHHLQY